MFIIANWVTQPFTVQLSLVSFRTAVETLGKLCECLDLREYAARMIHPLMRILDTAPELHTAAMDTLTAIVTQMGRDYLIFVPAVYKVGVMFLQRVFFKNIKNSFATFQFNFSFSIICDCYNNESFNNNTIYCICYVDLFVIQIKHLSFVLQVLAKSKISHQKYDCVVTRIQKGGFSLEFNNELQRKRQQMKSSVEEDESAAVSDRTRKLHVSANNLQKVNCDLKPIQSYHCKLAKNHVQR